MVSCSITLNDPPEKFSQEKRRVIKAAKDLGYSKIVVDKLEQATTSAQMTNIMKDARNGKYGRT